jgi:hypothetical protein
VLLPKPTPVNVDPSKTFRRDKGGGFRTLPNGINRLERMIAVGPSHGSKNCGGQDAADGAMDRCDGGVVGGGGMAG